jgi:ubiquinone/menaquinone biosynthesis C-methylase UbiE
MEVTDAAALIEPAFRDKREGSVWADLGSGSGTFTKALSLLLGKTSQIIAVDKERQRIEPTAPNQAVIEFVKLDFVVDTFPFRQIDGILMANSLHFVKDKPTFINRVKDHVKPGGKIIVVEYDRKKPSRWVPYPIGFNEVIKTFSVAGFHQIEKIGERDSIYGPEKIYACSIIRDMIFHRLGDHPE